MVAIYDLANELAGLSLTRIRKVVAKYNAKLKISGHSKLGKDELIGHILQKSNLDRTLMSRLIKEITLQKASARSNKEPTVNLFDYITERMKKEGFPKPTQAPAPAPVEQGPRNLVRGFNIPRYQEVSPDPAPDTEPEGSAEPVRRPETPTPEEDIAIPVPIDGVMYYLDNLGDIINENGDVVGNVKGEGREAYSIRNEHIQKIQRTFPQLAEDISGLPVGGGGVAPRAVSNIQELTGLTREQFNALDPVEAFGRFLPLLARKNVMNVPIASEDPETGRLKQIKTRYPTERIGSVNSFFNDQTPQQMLDQVEDVVKKLGPERYAELFLRKDNDDGSIQPRLFGQEEYLREKGVELVNFNTVDMDAVSRFTRYYMPEIDKFIGFGGTFYQIRRMDGAEYVPNYGMIVDLKFDIFGIERPIIDSIRASSRGNPKTLVVFGMGTEQVEKQTSIKLSDEEKKFIHPYIPERAARVADLTLTNEKERILNMGVIDKFGLNKRQIPFPKVDVSKNEPWMDAEETKIPLDWWRDFLAFLKAHKKKFIMRREANEKYYWRQEGYLLERLSPKGRLTYMEVDGLAEALLRRQFDSYLKRYADHYNEMDGKTGFPFSKSLDRLEEMWRVRDDVINSVFNKDFARDIERGDISMREYPILMRSWAAYAINKAIIPKYNIVL